MWCEGGLLLTPRMQMALLSRTEAGSEAVSWVGDGVDFKMSMRHPGRSMERASEIIKLHLSKYIFKF